MNLALRWRRVLEDLPGRLLDAEQHLHRILTLAGEHRQLISSLIANLANKPVPATFVYLIPPVGPMLAQRLQVEPGKLEYLVFEPYTEIPPGTWVVSVGPAIVRGVKVGNMMQSGMNDYQGHVCQTKEPAPPGVRLTVELGG